MPNDARCVWRGCERPAAMTYCGRPICGKHWQNWCMIDDNASAKMRKEALARMGLCEMHGQVMEITHATDDIG